MDDTWNAEDYVLKLLELLPDEPSRALIASHRHEVAELFRQAFADGVEIGTVAERLTAQMV